MDPLLGFLAFGVSLQLRLLFRVCFVLNSHLISCDYVQLAYYFLYEIIPIQTFVNAYLGIGLCMGYPGSTPIIYHFLKIVDLAIRSGHLTG